MSTTVSFTKATSLVFLCLIVDAQRAEAEHFLLDASGTISSNSTSDSTIPVGTPWTFQLGYDTDAPDLDFELTGSPDPTFGRFTNTSAPPALISFHYQAGDYEVSIDDPADIASGSEIIITFTSVNAIDVNVHAPGFFPALAGGAVSFHADFNAFSMAPIFTSDSLPSNTELSAESFDQSTVTLLPPGGAVTGGLESLTLTPLPEPSSSAPFVAGIIALIAAARRSRGQDE